MHGQCSGWTAWEAYRRSEPGAGREGLGGCSVHRSSMERVCLQTGGAATEFVESDRQPSRSTTVRRSRVRVPALPCFR